MCGTSRWKDGLLELEEEEEEFAGPGTDEYRSSQIPSSIGELGRDGLLTSG